MIAGNFFKINFVRTVRCLPCLIYPYGHMREPSNIHKWWAFWGWRGTAYVWSQEWWLFCHAFFLELWRAATIWPSLYKSATATLVVAIIISRLDYYNSVFAGLQADQVTQLQPIQNKAAWLVMKKRKPDHVTPLFKELHWLPVKFLCQYKIATGLLPFQRVFTSISFFISLHLWSSRSLRSSKEKLLKIPKRNLKPFGEHSFSFMAPSVWN